MEIKPGKTIYYHEVSRIIDQWVAQQMPIAGAVPTLRSLLAMIHCATYEAEEVKLNTNTRASERGPTNE